nr:L1 [Kittiwake papillomavirus 1]QBR99525.1 L1 [Kittiwake papillomavirus 1]
MSVGPLPAALYIPSTQPVPSFFSTDDFVEQTQYVYHCGTDRLLTVGHPYYEIRLTDADGVAVPKVSPNQYRCFRLRLPDPNGQFPMPASNISDPDKYRFVWKVVGIEVTRGQPLGIGLAGAPQFNRARDVESPSGRNNNPDVAERVNTAIDPKQNQMMIVGCSPAYGEHWAISEPCRSPAPRPQTECPPIELASTYIQDGDMGDIGFGAMDFGMLCRNRSDVPLELVGEVSKYPDWIRMRTDPTGDSCFYMVRREQMYCRRMWMHGGGVGERIPEKTYRPDESEWKGLNCAYLAVPSGSVSTTDTQLFNRPYWLSQAQGYNNGVCWSENLFVTILDNTRGSTLHITHVPTAKSSSENTQNYNVTNYTEYQRHVEEYEICCLLRLCRVPLRSDVLAHIYRTNPKVLSAWGISEAPAPGIRAEDKYRFIESFATRCPLPPDPPEPDADPYASLNFWTIDCSDRLSLDLLMYPLGRKFLSLLPHGVSRKRSSAALTSSSNGSSAPRRSARAKRRRVAR